MLEGLATKRGGLAPALLLQALAKVRSTDGAEVAEVVAGLREPDTRGQAVADGLDLATGLLVEPEFDDGDDEADDGPVAYELEHDDVDEIVGALGELQAVHPEDDEAPEAALAALTALDRRQQHDPRAPASEGGEPEQGELQEDAASGDVAEDEQVTAAEPPPPPPAEVELPPSPPATPPPDVERPEIIDWSRWQPVEPELQPAPSSRRVAPAAPIELASPPFDAHAVLGALGAQQSIISQLQVLRRELSGFAGSSVQTLQHVVDAFPDGWARRRALAAMLEAGLPPEAGDAIELIAGLGRASDRAWCLGVLARRGGLFGSHLERALALLESPAARRRVEAAAARAGGVPAD
jgi:hypothetical protein